MKNKNYYIDLDTIKSFEEFLNILKIFNLTIVFNAEEKDFKCDEKYETVYKHIDWAKENDDDETT